MDNLQQQANFTYHLEAYNFVDKAIKKALTKLDNKRHLSAYEVLISCRETAIKEYGFLAGEVLRSWGIKSSKDIGEVVYQMIQNNILSASKEDKKSDFEIQFDLFDVGKINNNVTPKKVHDPIICD